MATVYVVQDDGRFDLTDARRFGELSIIYRKDLYPDNVNEQTPIAVKRAYEVLHAFNPDVDSLCLVGSPLYTAICSYVLGDLGKNPVKLLRFDRTEAQYYTVTVE